MKKCMNSESQKCCIRIQVHTVVPVPYGTMNTFCWTHFSPILESLMINENNTKGMGERKDCPVCIQCIGKAVSPFCIGHSEDDFPAESQSCKEAKFKTSVRQYGSGFETRGNKAYRYSLFWEKSPLKYLQKNSSSIFLYFFSADYELVTAFEVKSKTEQKSTRKTRTISFL